MNDLEKFFFEGDHRRVHKWRHYFDVYDRHFSRFRGKDVCVVEVGVAHGGSLQMWKHYFGENAKIYGIDINPQCAQFAEDQVTVLIGDQNDDAFLQRIKNEVPKIDILIDDGGHRMEQQIRTFETLFDHIDENGVYLCEDLCTSYWQRYGGGDKKRWSFIEYSKRFVDYINAWYSETDRLRVNKFSESVYSLNYYSGMLVIEKRPFERPTDIAIGKETITPRPHDLGLSVQIDRILTKCRRYIQSFFR